MKAKLKKVEQKQKITGMHPGIRGDVSGIRGDVTGIWGDLDNCQITKKEREKGINIAELVA